MKVEIKKEFEKVIKDRIKKDNQFSSVEEYINHILEQVVERLRKEGFDHKNISKKQQKEVEKRLRSLGYLN
ncbi:MAG: hypothetical protein H8D38_06805 [DPANN group archaeon]|nr:hypothetical protein [DPANN group archaeon]